MWYTYVKNPGTQFEISTVNAWSVKFTLHCHVFLPPMLSVVSLLCTAGYISCSRYPKVKLVSDTSQWERGGWRWGRENNKCMTSWRHRKPWRRRGMAWRSSPPISTSDLSSNYKCAVCFNCVWYVKKIVSLTELLVHPTYCQRLWLVECIM